MKSILLPFMFQYDYNPIQETKLPTSARKALSSVPKRGENSLKGHWPSNTSDPKIQSNSNI